jgi:TPR repeat protein
MSFLGLNEAPGGGAEYLLEEEEGERSANWGRILTVLLVLAAVGGLGWQWYHGGYPFTRPANQANNVAAPTAASPAASTPAASASPSAVAPAETAAPAADAPVPATKTEPETTPAAQPAQEAPAESKPAAATAEKSVPEEKTPPAAAPEKAPRAPVRRPAPGPEVPAVPGEAFYVQGQRYLYGTGGSQPNCDLAVKSLMAAAGKLHPRAQSTLGTMYSTGHCVGRDLPTAYRWFAKALHQDPNNTRLEDDLSVVWKQMTPGEQQQAMKKD